MSNSGVLTSLDARIAELAEKYLPLAAEMLKEAIRIPADYVDKPADQGGDPACGTSNHEFPRLDYLRKKIVAIKAVRRDEDAFFDEFGNLVWWVDDPNDGIAPADKKVIFIDGHTDTVKPLRAQWREKVGGVDCFDGLIDAGKVNKAFLKKELGYLPPESEWNRLIFGRGSADQLGGVVAAAIATKILLELEGEGALKGVIVRSYGTACEEDNDGAGPMYLVRKVFPTAAPELVPDVVILTDGTGCSKNGALGIYRGQRGRMQIEVTVTGKSCHGSMPWEGKNPLEFGGAIVKEAAEKYDKRIGFKDDKFLGHGTRTASWARLDTPSDCAVPEKFTFRFDRRLTIGETPEQSCADVEALDAVAAARAAGLQVDVSIPTYTEASWKGYVLNNPQVYLGWLTPEEHPAVQAAVEAYEKVITPHVDGQIGTGGCITKAPRVDRWVFSTDGVGFPVPKDAAIPGAARKNWVVNEVYKHPAMIGFGPGIEQNTHKIGECIDERELQHAAAFLARFPTVYAAK
ncbi:M20/M25/M40 family metallo-hydrolase [Mesoterricola sediminis]|uniref:Selenium metabolism hydrolase n=1 Tax=Mesoterricola sediminis TaxID=2927980 RepID=A0AA48GVW0_9BACT|nr:M20/M25/M40 family metallo-hydrolase [Mesoterricola sediminis]BDU78774.1 selenium metabolism hydrolase [Mesoterricola sediminis]